VSERRTLDRWFSRLGVASREMARNFVRAGRVRVDGLIVHDTELVVGERSRIELDGVVVTRAPRVVIALHKPVGYVTTRSDPAGRRTVYDLLTGLDAWVTPIGRLDRDSSGLLLLTNDTDLADRLTSPESHVPKRYRIEVRPRLTEEQLAALERGPELDDGPTHPEGVRLVAHKGPISCVELTLTEGRNRQVRRMVRAVGGKVTKLVRTRIGALELGDLARGEWRALTSDDLRALSD
jgi:23S rRNA pseudouridine2605 synthase